jgi:asparagine synthase (glutamine-hydrolysing)
MSNLCGWVGKSADEKESHRIIHLMTSTLPVDPRRSVTVVVSAASALGFAAHGNSGSVYDDKDICAAIEGYPVFNDSGLAHLARQQGTAKALVEGYRERGTDIIESLVGDFCFALLHKRKQRAFLAVDRLGVRPLSYTWNNGCLLFASSARAIRAHPDASHSINPQAIFNYLYFHIIPSPDCVYTGVRRLLPGTYAVLRDGELTARTYWSIEYREDWSTSFNELQREFLDLVKQSVRRTITTDNIGCFLSGGTDSSTVTGFVGEVTGKPARTYSIGFKTSGYDEIEYAHITAKHFGTEHHEYYVTPNDVIDAAPKIASAYANPYGNASAIPTYYCARLAKQDGIDKLLGGDGGDELFAGNARYARQYLFSLYADLPAILREGVIWPLVYAISAGGRIWPMGKLHSYITQAALPMPARLETYNLLGRLGVDNIFTAEFLQSVDRNEPLSILKEYYQSVHADNLVNRILGLDLKLTLSDNDLPKVTTMCELAGVDVAFPFLDDELVAFSARLPATFKLKGTKLRYLFKQALREFLPRATLTKSKHGFGLPFGMWLYTHKPLEEFVKDNLNQLTRRQIVRREFIRQLLQECLPKDPHYYGTMAWILLMLEQWYQHHVD